MRSHMTLLLWFRRSDSAEGQGRPPPTTSHILTAGGTENRLPLRLRATLHLVTTDASPRSLEFFRSLCLRIILLILNTYNIFTD